MSSATPTSWKISIVRTFNRCARGKWAGSPGALAGRSRPRPSRGAAQPSGPTGRRRRSERSAFLLLGSLIGPLLSTRSLGSIGELARWTNLTLTAAARSAD